jgi:hypothetical protein
VELRVRVPPRGPVTVAEWLQLPPAQLVAPEREVTPPFGPTNSWFEAQLPPAHWPLPEELQVRP